MATASRKDTPTIDPSRFATTALAFEAALIVVALVGAQLADIDLAAVTVIEGPAFAIGILAVIPIVVLLGFASNTRNVTVTTLGPALSRCNGWQLALLAMLAGAGEELLFRGTLQLWLASYSPVMAVIAVNVLFGALHAITPTYFVLTTAIGFYFSWLAYGIGEPNLLPPIITHALYDWLAFHVVINLHREQTSGS